jgi:hypothetical protein
MKLRNISVRFRIGSSGEVAITFTDWWDFADWLKEAERLKQEYTIVGWNYVYRSI